MWTTWMKECEISAERWKQCRCYNDNKHRTCNETAQTKVKINLEKGRQGKEIQYRETKNLTEFS